MFYATYRSVDPVLAGRLRLQRLHADPGWRHELHLRRFADVRPGAASSSSRRWARYRTRQPARRPVASSTRTASCVPSPAADLYNFGPLNYYQRPDERYTAGVFANFKIERNGRRVRRVHVHGRPLGVADRALRLVLRRHCGQLQQPAVVGRRCSTSSAASSASRRTTSTDLLIGRRNVEGGGRQDDIGHESYRLVAGVKGDLNDV